MRKSLRSSRLSGLFSLVAVKSAKIVMGINADFYSGENLRESADKPFGWSGGEDE